MEANLFLKDLYFRIDQFPIEIPPLRDRVEDIEPLVVHYCKKHSDATKRPRSILQKTVRLLERYSWPGNVGELEGYVLGLLERANEKLVRPSDPRVQSAEVLEQKYEENWKSNIERALRLSGSVPQAAKKIGIPATTLYSMMSRYKIKTDFEKTSV